MLDKLKQLIQRALATHRLNKVLEAENKAIKSQIASLEAETKEAEQIIDEALNELGS